MQLREERDALQAERDALSAKIDDAQVRLNAILEKLPRARASSEPDNQLDLLESAQPEHEEAESDVSRHGENAWQAPKPRYTRGVMAKYFALAQPANRGAVTG